VSRPRVYGDPTEGHINVRMTRAQRALLAWAAAKNRVSLSRYIVDVTTDAAAEEAEAEGVLEQVSVLYHVSPGPCDSVCAGSPVRSHRPDTTRRSSA
jgi:hypothetical protein